MTRVKSHGIKTTSKKTGAVILISMIVFIIISLVFLFLSMSESDKQIKLEDKWSLLSCDEMKKDHTKNPELWKSDFIIEKC